MDILLNTNEVINIDSVDFHKYHKTQGVYQNTVFVMAEEFEKEYDGYAVRHKTLEGGEAVSYFTHETVQKYGVRSTIPGKFDGKEFIKISLAHRDGTER